MSYQKKMLCKCGSYNLKVLRLFENYSSINRSVFYLLKKIRKINRTFSSKKRHNILTIDIFKLRILKIVKLSNTILI